jgi:hypothetical protein
MNWLSLCIILFLLLVSSLQNLQKFIRLCTVGITDGEIPPYGWIGQSPNSYAIAITSTRIPNSNNYQFRLAGLQHHFEFPEGVIRPEVKETGNVCGCGILMNQDDKMTIFFTFNGILIGSVLNIFT